MTSRIALVTCRELVTPDADEEALSAELPEAEIVAWEDPGVDWAAYDLVLLRSTWNYIERLPEFLAWAERVAAVTTLLNPVDVVRWNTDKRYLADLEAAGLPIVPSAFFAPDDEVPASAVSGHVVVKPTVSNGSNGAKLFDADPEAALAHAAALQALGKHVLVQPYMSQVDELGETALIYVAGQFSHAASKAAILSREMSWSTGIYADEKVRATTATDAERELADRILAALPAIRPATADLAYARIDLLPTPDGPVILELELTEPSLFLALGEGAAASAARAFRAISEATS